ncbi:MAG TPA: uridine kinase [Microbacteriaceae bacterium]|jgi:uridine kinase|nr:uridine kinase [Microbacteriaceae bacterium]
MARWAPAKKDQLDALAAEILHNYGSGRAIVAIDGFDGGGKTHFADDLAAAITATGHSVFRASIDDFHRSRAERHARGADSAEGFYRDSFDYTTFRRVLIEPFKLGGSTAFVTAAFDHRRDAPMPSKWRTGPKDAILIVDGIFINRPELRGLWNYSVWLDVPREIAEQRMADRDGPEENAERYRGGQDLYLAEANPRAAAVAIIDNRDFEHPRRVFADAC